MIKLGICTSVENLGRAHEAGFDYIEANLSAVTAMSDEEFEEAVRLNEEAPIHVETMNGMLPGNLRVTGPNVSAQAIHDYLDRAFERAERLGAQVIVFGSSAARTKPEGFDTAQAWRQLANFLRICEKHAAAHNLLVAIEPLKRAETNMINYVSEAVALASFIQMPHIAVLGDTYHMAMGGESYASLTMAGDLLAHVHVANAIGRRCPAPGDGEPYRELFDTLKDMGYEGRVSVESLFADFDAEIGPAYEVLRQARD